MGGGKPPPNHFMFNNLWHFIWQWGWLGFIAIACYAFLGAVVFINAMKHTKGSLRFFRFFGFSLLCGPIGWLAFPFWFIYKICSIVDLEEMGKWLSRSTN